MTWLLRVLAALVLLYGLTLCGMYLFQRRLLYRPDANLPRPEEFGLTGVEVVRVRTNDGLDLVVWYRPPPEAGGYVVLYLHGNGGNIGYRWKRLARMAELGWGSLLLEYRGYGGNAGKPNQDGLTLDAEAGLAELRRRGIPLERILLWGESLGTYLAIRLGTEHRVAAVLLELLYTSIADVAQRQYRFLPVRPFMKDRFESLALIARVQAPILIMQGAKDNLVPPAMGQALQRASKGSVEIWIAPQAGHFDLGPAGAVDAAAEFVTRLPDARIRPE